MRLDMLGGPSKRACWLFEDAEAVVGAAHVGRRAREPGLIEEVEDDEPRS